MAKITVFVIMVVISINNVWNMQVIFERSNMSYINEKYLADVKTNVRRYVRRGNYYLNLIGTTKHTWGNNVTIDFVFYEFLHNEYKRSFVEFAFKLCDLVSETKYIGRALIAAGLECPVPPRHWILANISIPTHDFPNLFPFEKCRLDARAMTFPEKELIAELQVHLLMKQPIGK